MTSVHVPAGEDKTLTFETKADKSIKPGRYRFRIVGETHDGRFKLTENINIRVIEKKEEIEKDRGIKLTTSYPVFRGPVKGKFEFSVDMENQLDKDANFDLFATE